VSNGQEKSRVLSWDDAIRLAKAKIEELKYAVKGFEMAKARGDEWPKLETQGNQSCPS
jgi:hypothetical protein